MELHPLYDLPVLFTLSREGTLVYVPDSEEVSVVRTLVWVDREGNEELLEAPPRQYRYVDLSPDGKRFLMIKEERQAQEGNEVVETPPTTELIVVDNWDEVLKRLAPSAEK